MSVQSADSDLPTDLPRNNRKNTPETNEDKALDKRSSESRSLSSQSKGNRTSYVINHKNQSILELQAVDDLQFKIENGLTPLHRAIRDGQRSVAQTYILQQSEWINAKSNEGLTPLMEACILGDVNMVKMLVERRDIIDLDATDNDGNTALMHVINLPVLCFFPFAPYRSSNKNPSSTGPTTPTSVTSRPLTYGSSSSLLGTPSQKRDDSTTKQQSETSRILRLRQIQYEIAEILIRNGASVMKRNLDQRTALDLLLEHQLRLEPSSSIPTSSSSSSLSAPSSSPASSSLSAPSSSPASSSPLSPTPPMQPLNLSPLPSPTSSNRNSIPNTSEAKQSEEENEEDIGAKLVELLKLAERKEGVKSNRVCQICDTNRSCVVRVCKTDCVIS